MGTEALQQTLRDLARIGTVVDRNERWQLWRFVHDGRPYLLRMYPAKGRWRLLRPPSSAMREFASLQALQKAAIPAPRAIAVLMGFVLDDLKGDAVIFESIEESKAPAITLSRYLNDLELAGEPVPHHLELARQLRTLLHGIGRAKLGDRDLGIDRFILSGQKIFVRSGIGLRPGGLQSAEVLRFGQTVRRWATVADLHRGWELLGAESPIPTGRPAAARIRRLCAADASGENDGFGEFQWSSPEAGRWRGRYFKRIEHPYRWSAVSRMAIDGADWRNAWPILWGQIRCDQLTVLKRDASGDVLEGEVVLGGRPVGVIVKRPRRKYWWRHVNEIGRGARAVRAWKKAWQLIAADIPTAWPMLVMEQRTLGYTADAVIVAEKVDGPTLATIDLNGLAATDRRTLFHRAGAILRRMEAAGLFHWDAKSTNWIIRPDEKLGPSPLLVDVDGIRRIRWTRSGIGRLLRAMKLHPQYTPEDSLALCRGYAPRAAATLPGRG